MKTSKMKNYKIVKFNKKMKKIKAFKEKIVRYKNPHINLMYRNLI